MSNSPALPLGRLAAEFFVIVTGVLVALGGQAWYEGREETEREIAALEAIRADLIRIEEEVGARRDREVANFEGVQETLGILRGEIERPDDWTPDVGLGFQKLALPLGSLDALVASGDTRLIRSDELRSELIAFRDRQQAQEDWIAAFDQATIDRTSQLIDDLERMLIAAGIDASNTTGPPLQLFPIEDLRLSPEIRGYLTFSGVMSAGRSGAFGNVVREAAALRQAIEEELDARGVDFEPIPETPSSDPDIGSDSAG